MTYLDLLRDASQKNNSIVCMGADPVIDKIPLKGSIEDNITKFYSDILDAAEAETALPGTIKPNYAFYAQYGFEGLRALKKVIDKAREKKVPVILDAKRGDIGKTSAAYAKEVFDFWGADAVTIAPYMGSDSVGPFIDCCARGKGVYILNRTSNKGAVDLQNLSVEGVPLYIKAAEKIVEWGSNTQGVGAVVGATSTQELDSLAQYYSSKGNIPLLIPGVGSQGGSAEEVTRILKARGLDLGIQRINSSSGINYAYLEKNTTDYAGAAVEAIRELNKEIGFK